jgi:hypothetical protein
MPAEVAAPIIVDTEANAVRMVLVRRESISSLDVDEWSDPGVYVLLGAVDYEGLVNVYVGKSGSGKQGPRGRIQYHHSNPPIRWWRAAAFRSLIQGKTWNSAQIGYLEGRIAAELEPVKSIKLYRGKTDMDLSLSPLEEGVLETIVPVILANLRLLGLPIELDSTDEPDVQPTAVSKGDTTTKGKRKARAPKTRVTLSDLLASGELKVGEEFVFERKKKKKKKVSGSITTNGGMLVNGKEFLNPSSAAVAAFPGQVKTANGWSVWKQANKPHKSLLQLRKRYVSSKAASERQR